MKKGVDICGSQWVIDHLSVVSLCVVYISLSVHIQVYEGAHVVQVHICVKVRDNFRRCSSNAAHLFFKTSF